MPFLQGNLACCVVAFCGMNCVRLSTRSFCTYPDSQERLLSLADLAQYSKSLSSETFIHNQGIAHGIYW